MLCKIAGIARSSYYKWSHRNEPESEVENARIAEIIKHIHEKDPSKGYRRIRDDLCRDHGIDVNDKRVLRICRAFGIRSNIKYCCDGCTINYRNPAHVAENVLNRDFTAEAPYEIGDSNNNHLVFSNFEHTVELHPDAHPIFHSDRGFQYTTATFHQKLMDAEMTQSMSRVGKCLDNGPMEGFWGILKRERYYEIKFTGKEELTEMITSECKL